MSVLGLFARFVLALSGSPAESPELPKPPEDAGGPGSCPAFCQSPGSPTWGSTRMFNTRVADRLRIAQAATASHLCWRGVYTGGCAPTFPDDFRIVYYSSVAGLPGLVIGGPFLQSAGALAVQRSSTGRLVNNQPEFEYVATHADVAIPAGCFWVEITNGGVEGCGWFWTRGSGGDQRCARDTQGAWDSGDMLQNDMTLCLNVPLAATTPTQCDAPVLPEDSCAHAAPLTCGSVVVVDNRIATTSPGVDPLFPCAQNSQGSGTVWYSIVATGPTLQIDTCNSLSTDTLLALYSGSCAAPLTIGCANDTSGCGPNGRSGRLCVTGLATGQTYLLQVASTALSTRGVIEVRVSCTCTQPCSAPPQNCQAVAATAVTAGPNTRNADDFQLASAGSQSGVCAWGAYLDDVPNVNDSFEIAYYANGPGQVPGALIQSYSQSAGTLLVLDQHASASALASGQRIYEYHFAHAPLPLAAATCYWIEVRNLAPTHPWMWCRSSQPNGGSARDRDNSGGYAAPWDHSAGDLAWCLSAAPNGNTCTVGLPANTSCVTAAPIGCSSTSGTTVVDNSRGGTNMALPCGTAEGALWYSFIATSEQARLRLCNSPAPGNTRLALYGGTCQEPVQLACAAGGCGSGGAQADLLASGLTPGQTYWVVFGVADVDSRGAYELELDCQPAAACSGFMRGDADTDGVVNNFDIDAFVLAIVDAGAYMAQFGTAGFICRNDANGDGSVNNFDIDAFVACILALPPPGQGCP